MRKITILLAALFCILMLNVSLSEDDKLSGKKKNLVGSGEFKVMLWHVYNAELYSKDGEFSFDKPFKLKLNYQMDIDGEDIAKRSEKEIRKIGYEDEIKLAGWYSEMKDIFPDVKEGDSITGIYKPDSETVFLYNDKEIGKIQDNNFGKWFFGIWLNENTRQPKFREKLLGKSGE